MEIIGVTQGIMQHLRNEIILGRIVPGERLNEAQLASDLRVSRAPLREALRMLQSEGLVYNEPRRGTYVTELSVEHLENLYQAREMVECHAIELLKVKNIRDLPHAVMALKEARKMSEPITEGREDTLRYLIVFAGYHQKLVASAGNEILGRFYSSISHQLARYQVMYLSIPATRKSSFKAHGDVITSIEHGDFDVAKETMRGHIRSTCEVLKSKILEMEGKYEAKNSERLKTQAK